MSVGEVPGANSRTRLDALLHAGRRTADIVDPHPVAPDGEFSNGSHYMHRQARGRVTPRRQRPEGLPSSAIHELRTPLTSIHGYAQILQRTMSENPRAANALAVILRESARLTQMLSALSDVAELTGDADDSGSTPAVGVDVRQLVDVAVEVVAETDSGRHPISVAGSGRTVCDARRLRQAIDSVLTNAVLYSPEGAQVAVTVDDSEGQVRIWVADRGIGIPHDDAERVYGAFERGSNARSFGVRGLGLGLFVARQALAVEGGTIRHEPRPDGGTVFLIEMPRR